LVRRARVCCAPCALVQAAAGDFALDGRSLRLKGINRIGNLLVPNDNYVRRLLLTAPAVATASCAGRCCLRNG
jgi:deoxyhypusine synthase